MQVLQVKMYSLKPFDAALRGTFELLDWPYFNGVGKPPPVGFVNYMRSLDVVHYQDDYDKSPHAILIDSQNFNFREMKPTKMFFNYGLLDDNWKIMRWGNERPELRKVIVEKTGDDFAWYEWNKPIEVLAMSDVRVQRVPEMRVPLSKGVRPLRVK